MDQEKNDVGVVDESHSVDVEPLPGYIVHSVDDYVIDLERKFIDNKSNFGVSEDLKQIRKLSTGFVIDNGYHADFPILDNVSNGDIRLYEKKEKELSRTINSLSKICQTEGISPSDNALISECVKELNEFLDDVSLRVKEPDSFSRRLKSVADHLEKSGTVTKKPKKPFSFKNLWSAIAGYTPVSQKYLDAAEIIAFDSVTKNKFYEARTFTDFIRNHGGETLESVELVLDHNDMNKLYLTGLKSVRFNQPEDAVAAYKAIVKIVKDNIPTAPKEVSLEECVSVKETVKNEYLNNLINFTIQKSQDNLGNNPSLSLRYFKAFVEMYKEGVFSIGNNIINDFASEIVTVASTNALKDRKLSVEDSSYKDFYIFLANNFDVNPDSINSDAINFFNYISLKANSELGDTFKAIADRARCISAMNTSDSKKPVYSVNHLDEQICEAVLNDKINGSGIVKPLSSESLETIKTIVGKNFPTMLTDYVLNVFAQYASSDPSKIHDYSARLTSMNAKKVIDVSQESIDSAVLTIVKDAKTQIVNTPYISETDNNYFESIKILKENYDVSPSVLGAAEVFEHYYNLKVFAQTGNSERAKTEYQFLKTKLKEKSDDAMFYSRKDLDELKSLSHRNHFISLVEQGTCDVKSDKR